MHKLVVSHKSLVVSLWENIGVKFVDMFFDWLMVASGSFLAHAALVGVASALSPPYTRNKGGTPTKAKSMGWLFAKSFDDPANCKRQP